MSVAIASGIIGIGSTLIERLFPDKQEQAKAKLELMQMEQQGELKELEVRMGAIMAEANSKDPWTSRARPTFMYTFYAVIVMLVMVAPAIGIFFPGQMEMFFKNVQEGFAAIPEALWYTFTVGYLGYAGARSYEKVKHVSK